jgi:hypothetical protein
MLWPGCPSESAHHLFPHDFEMLQRLIKLTIIQRFFYYWSQNEEARLKRDLDNAHFSHVVPVTIEDFFKSHKVDELDSAADSFAFEV